MLSYNSFKSKVVIKKGLFNDEERHCNFLGN